MVQEDKQKLDLYYLYREVIWRSGKFWRNFTPSWNTWSAIIGIYVCHRVCIFVCVSFVLCSRWVQTPNTSKTHMKAHTQSQTRTPIIALHVSPNGAKFLQNVREWPITSLYLYTSTVTRHKMRRIFEVENILIILWWYFQSLRRISSFSIGLYRDLEEIRVPL